MVKCTCCIYDCKTGETEYIEEDIDLPPSVEPETGVDINLLKKLIKLHEHELARMEEK